MTVSSVCAAQELVLRAFTCVCKQPAPPGSVPPLFAHLEEVDPCCRPRTTQGASVAFEYNGRLQFWTVPETGVYRITARGAKAADGTHRCCWQYTWCHVGSNRRAQELSSSDIMPCKTAAAAMLCGWFLQ